MELVDRTREGSLWYRACLAAKVVSEGTHRIGNGLEASDLRDLITLRNNLVHFTEPTTVIHDVPTTPVPGDWDGEGPPPAIEIGSLTLHRPRGPWDALTAARVEPLISASRVVIP